MRALESPEAPQPLEMDFATYRHLHRWSYLHQDTNLIDISGQIASNIARWRRIFADIVWGYSQLPSSSAVSEL